jgi:hypothetical protein
MQGLSTLEIVLIIISLIGGGFTIYRIGLVVSKNLVLLYKRKIDKTDNIDELKELWKKDIQIEIDKKNLKPKQINRIKEYYNKKIEDSEKYSRIDKETKKIERRERPLTGLRKKDRVHFTITAPPKVEEQSSFIINLWTHLDQQREELLKRAREMAEEGKIKIQSVGPEHVTRGTKLLAALQINDLNVKDPIKSILWEGEIASTNYSVNVPKGVSGGKKDGTIKIFVEGCLITTLDFKIIISDTAKEIEQIPTIVKQYHKAFCCYASADRNQVIYCIQGIKKVAPDMEIFLDVLLLRSGENWEEKIREIIPQNDIFYLFWSQNAKKSKWVEKEWRCALETKGLDFIDPVPLSREIIPPPPELEGKHFYNGILRFIRELKDYATLANG